MENQINKTKKSKRSLLPKAPKVVKSEMELAHQQAHKMLKDMNRLIATQRKTGLENAPLTAVDLWKDTDFFFSVVFQSERQKYDFLEQFSKMFSLGIDNAKTGDNEIQIINGLTLAKNLKINLKLEKGANYPYPNLELKNMALDSEIF